MKENEESINEEIRRLLDGKGVCFKTGEKKKDCIDMMRLLYLQSSTIGMPMSLSALVSLIIDDSYN